jgi:hypothetical protein
MTLDLSKVLRAEFAGVSEQNRGKPVRLVTVLVESLSRDLTDIYFNVDNLLYVFFWVFPRRQIVICRRFGTLCHFHLQRWN